jgi:hypothetical protein
LCSPRELNSGLLVHLPSWYSNRRLIQLPYRQLHRTCFYSDIWVTFRWIIGENYRVRTENIVKKRFLNFPSSDHLSNHYLQFWDQILIIYIFCCLLNRLNQPFASAIRPVQNIKVATKNVNAEIDYWQRCMNEVSFCFAIWSSHKTKKK